MHHTLWSAKDDDDTAYGQWWARQGSKGAYTPPPPVGYVHVVNADGTVIARKEVPHYDRDWWQVAITEYPIVEKDGVLAVEVPESHIGLWTESPVTFYPCTYTAAEKYVQAMFGRTLDESDKQWLARHPLAKDDGVPQEYTATAIHELLEPYGLGVSRIRFRKGLLNAGDEPLKWMAALGCNPMAAIDHRTSNADAAALLGLTLEQADSMFRMEYHDEPFKPSIVGERGWSGGAGAQVGASGGHARYLAPRSHPGDWVVSLQLAPLSSIKYLQPPVPTKYVSRTGARSFSLIDVKGKDGKPFVERRGATYVRIGSKSTTAPQVSRVPALPPASTSAGPAIRCVKCERITVSTSDRAHRLALCSTCYAKAWLGLECPNKECRQALEDSPPLLLARYGVGDMDFSCVACNSTLTFGKNSEMPAVFEEAFMTNLHGTRDPYSLA